MSHRPCAAIIGGGVIGAGWLARFLLHGWDVRLFDPDPQAERKTAEVLANARRSLPGLYDQALPAEGSLQFCETIEQAVSGADWIQESVPENLQIKQPVYQQIVAAAKPEAVIASSTSGFKPSELAAGLHHASSILVAHPFNPVYLLPLVEIVPHAGTDPSIVASALEILTTIGMKPVTVRKEIDAHVADRLLEALWRESLWLIKDAITTTEELDDIIRFGFGIRFAQMGIFETYRVAGGEAGMRHFLSQFGPCLKWPWTRLMEVPELDDALIDTIAAQSDEQSGQYSIRELERLRDNNLVAILRALKRQHWGAGQLLHAQDQQLSTTQAQEIDWSEPVTTLSRTIPLDWTDYNGHMNETHYLELFSKACDRLMEMLGCDSDYIAAGLSYFTAENHIIHLDEAHAGDSVTVRTQCLQGEGKKLHLMHHLYHADGRLIATGEQMLLHVSLNTRKSIAVEGQLAEKLAEVMALQSQLPRPERIRCGIR
jgi:carnitine 3-dehydrogenase